MFHFENKILLFTYSIKSMENEFLSSVSKEIMLWKWTIFEFKHFCFKMFRFGVPIKVNPDKSFGHVQFNKWCLNVFIVNKFKKCSSFKHVKADLTITVFQLKAKWLCADRTWGLSKFKKWVTRDTYQIIWCTRHMFRLHQTHKRLSK